MLKKRKIKITKYTKIERLVTHFTSEAMEAIE